MARYIGPACKLCRREGVKLFLKGQRCKSHRCAFQRRAVAPGVHGQKRKQRPSEYGLQLREKQKAKRLFGILERQFKKYFKKADGREGVTGENLLILIERRLDNIVYKLGFAPSRKLARQLIVHRHFLVNSRIVNKPSFAVKEGDIVVLKAKSKELLIFKSVLEKKEEITVPSWLESSLEKFEGKIVRIPARDEIDIPVNEQLIVELYSK
ncbi:30S ribosomal protein S4 [bacterium]